MQQFLIIGSIIIIACILSNKIASRFGIPMLLAFIVLGMLFGSEGIFKIPFDNFFLQRTSALLHWSVSYFTEDSVPVGM